MIDELQYAIEYQPKGNPKPMGIWLMRNSKPQKLILDVAELNLTMCEATQICGILNSNLKMRSSND